MIALFDTSTDLNCI
ncbi:hypothetical protein EUTSA_v10029457mg, partial [Eutrema salsugineum]